MSDEILNVNEEDENPGSFELSESNKAYILLNYDKKSLKELTQYVSGDPKANGQTIIGRAIREFLKTKGLEYETTKFKKSDDIILTEEQEEFLRQNISSMKTLEATRVLFKNDKLSPLSKEFKSVYKFLDKITPGITKREDAPVDGEYKTPTSIYKVMQTVNKYVSNQRKENEPLYKSAEKLQAQDVKNLTALLSYMKIPRFGFVADQYQKQMDREVFESTFVGMTYDKPDLLREEVEQYISLSSEIVTTAQIDRQIQFLDQQMENTMNSADGAKVSMSLIEAINAARERQDKSKERQKKLISELTGSRAERMKGRIDANASILNLVDAWKDEEKRKKLLELARLQKQNERKEVDQLADMESVLCLIAGVTKDEIT